ncbi:MAG: hypothetical protein JJ959_13915 [Nisaea sp.]|uniref:hypothetical protein n=1 Tax=Nisaea sp. TaxID=2024842 RepID=UPI001B0885EE|nr:hypothetical protein [Nisaea sp.]MBO6561635.1 hypothetical protein [Nisaea sp.]
MSFGLGALFQKWRDFALPAISTILLPWQDFLTGLTLLPAYYQPYANVSIPFLSIIACVILNSFYTGLNVRGLLWRLGVALLVLIGLVIIFALFRANLGQSWHPEGAMMLGARTVFVLSYLFAWAGLAVVLYTAAIIIKIRKTPGQTVQ